MFCKNSIWWTAIQLIRTSGGFWTTLEFTFYHRWILTVSRWPAKVNATGDRAVTTPVASTWIETSRITSNRTTREDNRRRTPSKNGRPRSSSCSPVDFTVAPWWPAIRSTTHPILVSHMDWYGCYIKMYNLVYTLLK